jgi:outer membrane protein assembly factor BamB
MLFSRRLADALRRHCTACCSAIGLVAACGFDVGAQSAAPASRQVKQTRSADDKTPLPLFPIAPLWTLALNNALTAAPAFDQTRGFFPLEGDQFAVYDVVAGRQVWMASIRTTVEPVAGDGLVFVVESETLVALRAEDGHVVWRVPFADTLAVPPALTGNWLVMATTTGEIVARRASDGAVVWRQHLSAPAHARPAIAGTRLFVPTADSRVVALNRDTGAPLWNRLLGKPGNDILAADERLYLGSEDRYFYCVNATTGVVEWRWPTGANVIGRPVVDEQTVYFVSLDNVLRALTRSSGVQRWKSPLPLRPSTGPLKWSQTLVVAGTTPGLQAYNAADGKPAGQSPTASELSAPPHLVSDPSWPLPILLAVTSDITGRTTVTASTRTVEPAIVSIAPLPNAAVPALPAVAPEGHGAVSPLPNLFRASPAAGPRPLPAGVQRSAARGGRA